MSEQDTTAMGPGTPIPANFPYAQELKGGGYATLEDVDGASDEQLHEVNGIGPQKVKSIRKALDDRAAAVATEPDPEQRPSESTPSKPQSAAPTVPAVPDGQTPLPPDFPCRHAFLAAGITSVEQVRHLGDPTTVPGVKAEHITPVRRAAGYPGAAGRGYLS